MGCIPLHGTQASKDNNRITTNNNTMFTLDERLRLKEVWLVVRQSGFKKLGDDIMNKALERNATLKTYWQTIAFSEENHLLSFDQNNADLIWKQCVRHHGYKTLEKIDQIILVMAATTKGTTTTTTDGSDDAINTYFQRIADAHSQYSIRQEHINVVIECFIECIKNVMYQNENDWSVKHSLAWHKFLILITNKFSIAGNNSP